MKKEILILFTIFTFISCGPHRLKCGPRRCDTQPLKFNNYEKNNSNPVISIWS